MASSVTRNVLDSPALSLLIELEQQGACEVSIRQPTSSASSRAWVTAGVDGARRSHG